MAGGNRSVMAFWMGGASSTPAPPAGYPSLLVFWMGGVGKRLGIFFRPVKFQGPVG